MDYPKTITPVIVGRRLYLQSNYTGEIARPYELRTLARMIRDMFRY